MLGEDQLAEAVTTEEEVTLVGTRVVCEHLWNRTSFFAVWETVYG